VVAVRVQGAPIRCRITYGEPLEYRDAPGGRLAIFPSNRIVAYGLQKSRTRCIYLFRTSSSPPATELRGVSGQVTLFYEGSTRRTVRRTNVALSLLMAAVGAAGVDALPDRFWLSLGDFIDRRGCDIEPLVTRLLEREGTF
jgi:hypothetical protein